VQTPVRYDEIAPSAPEGPIDLPALVPGVGELELDVGFGRGRSFLVRATSRPDLRVIGVELKAKWATKVEARRVKLGLVNAKALRADIKDLLERSGPDGCLARAFVHFPDPWWKKRHAKRRVLSQDLLDDLARLLMPGGELFIQTDVEDRFEAILALVTEHPAFAPRVIDANPFGAESNREVRAIEDGLPVYRVLAIRV
jgi:tRNA (guanine-N7-)-methyltransferase